MSDVRDELRQEYGELVESGYELIRSLNRDPDMDPLCLTHDYQLWYTRALPAVRSLLPDRCQEFISCYEQSGKTQQTGQISELFRTTAEEDSGIAYIHNPFVDRRAEFTRLMSLQAAILNSGLKRLDSKLADIEGILQAQLFDNELVAAAELLSKGFLRPAGALAGVVLERHLAQVAVVHTVNIGKKTPTLADLNDALKRDGVYDLPRYRKVQHLTDLRNYCAHSKEREPGKVEVRELIDGVSEAVKNIF